MVTVKEHSHKRTEGNQNKIDNILFVVLMLVVTLSASIVDLIMK